MNINKEKIGFIPRTICEVGTGGSEVLQCGNLLDLNSKFIFIEPNPHSFKLLVNKFSNDKRIVLYQAACADKSGQGKYYNNNHNNENASGFIEGVISPLMIGHNYQPKDDDATLVNFIEFNQIDDGTIDILFADCEGAEWFVINKMISRPKILCIETHSPHGFKNKFLPEIEKWMENNQYIKINSDSSDDLYILNI